MAGEIKTRVLHFDWEVSIEEFSQEKKLGGVVINNLIIFFKGPPVLVGQGLSLSIFTVSLRHTTVGRTPLGEGSARSRELYLTAHNTHNRETSIPPAGFEPATPGSERLRTHALDRVASGLGII